MKNFSTKTKQVLIVRKDLNMRKGKIAAQAAHASLMIFSQNAVISGSESPQAMFQCFLSPAAVKWFADSFAKICVYVNSEEELEAVYRQAMEAGLPAALCVDNGLTEFGGVATKTVVAIGPDYSEKIDKITGELPLF